MSELRVGDHVVVNGETVVIVGFSPMSVVPQLVYVRGPETDERLDIVLLDEVERARNPQG